MHVKSSWGPSPVFVFFFLFVFVFVCVIFITEWQRQRGAEESPAGQRACQVELGAICCLCLCLCICVCVCHCHCHRRMTKTKRGRRISSWAGRMSSRAGGHLSACWGQEWSLTVGFRDSNALFPPPAVTHIRSSMSSLWFEKSFFLLSVPEFCGLNLPHLLIFSRQKPAHHYRCQYKIGRVDSLCQISTSDMWRQGWPACCSMMMMMMMMRRRRMMISKGGTLQDTPRQHIMISSWSTGWVGSNCFKIVFPGQARANPGNQGGSRSLQRAWDPHWPRGCQQKASINTYIIMIIIVTLTIMIIISRLVRGEKETVCFRFSQHLSLLRTHSSLRFDGDDGHDDDLNYHRNPLNPSLSRWSNVEACVEVLEREIFSL